MSNPTQTQVGGTHYKDMPIQPAEFCQRNQLGYCESNVVKYVCRHKQKGKRQDIEKAIHYLQLLLEIEYPEEEPSPSAPFEWRVHTPGPIPCLGKAFVEVRIANGDVDQGYAETFKWDGYPPPHNDLTIIAWRPTEEPAPPEHEWVKHIPGNAFPGERSTQIEVKFRDAQKMRGKAFGFNWSMHPLPSQHLDIVAWRPL